MTRAEVELPHDGNMVEARLNPSARGRTAPVGPRGADNSFEVGANQTQSIVGLLKPVEWTRCSYNRDSNKLYNQKEVGK